MFHGTIITLKPCIVILAVLIAHNCYAQETVYHDNVVIVLDTSGSMSEDMQGVKKMDAAKTALKEVLRQVPDTTHVGLLIFGSGNDWVYPLGPRDDEKLSRAIDRPSPSGGTPLGAYLKRGADRLLEQRQKQYGYGTYRLLVVTDGEAQDQVLVDRFAPEIMARGITLDVIGVAMRQDHTLARLANSYRRADDPQSLQRAIAEVFAEVSSSDDRATDEEAFALLEPIPVELASAMIGALATSGNEPIGNRMVQASRHPVPGVQHIPRQQPRPSQSGQRGGSRGNPVIWFFVIACLVLFGLSKGGRKARRRR